MARFVDNRQPGFVSRRGSIAFNSNPGRGKVPFPLPPPGPYRIEYTCRWYIIRARVCACVYTHHTRLLKRQFGRHTRDTHVRVCRYSKSRFERNLFWEETLISFSFSLSLFLSVLFFLPWLCENNDSSAIHSRNRELEAVSAANPERE